MCKMLSGFSRTNKVHINLKSKSIINNHITRTHIYWHKIIKNIAKLITVLPVFYCI